MRRWAEVGLFDPVEGIAIGEQRGVALARAAAAAANPEALLDLLTERG